MAVDRRFPPMNVMECVVDLDRHLLEAKQWDKIFFASKKAYGCGKRGQDVVDGLELHLRRVNYPDLTSFLSIGITDKSLRFIHKEFGDDRKRLNYISPRKDMNIRGDILVADEHVAVLSLHFRLRDCKKLFYYLVYDSKSASLSMIPCVPDPFEATYTYTPVLESSGSRGDYVLVLLGRDLSADDSSDEDVLCICNPETRLNSASVLQTDISPWKIIRRSSFPAKVKEPFFTDMMFSLEGKAIWADLMQGLVYCNVHTCFPSGDVNLMFSGLPKGYRVNFMDEAMDTEESFTEPTKMSRTICCVRGSIYFICIDRPGACGDEVVTIFAKDLPDRFWRKKQQLTAKQLWELDGFEEAALPKVAPEYPIMMPDGVLSFKLQGEHGSYICSVDMSNMSLLWHGYVNVGNFHTTETIIVPSDFFGTKRVRRGKLSERPASHRH